MPMNEYERIRSKNRKHNAAYEEYQYMLRCGYTNSDIVSICNKELISNKGGSLDPRNEILLMLINLAGGQDEKRINDGDVESYCFFCSSKRT